MVTQGPVRHLFFQGGWVGMHRLLAPLPRPAPLGFAIGGSGGAGALRVGKKHRGRVVGVGGGLGAGGVLEKVRGLRA